MGRGHVTAMTPPLTVLRRRGPLADAALQIIT